MKFLLGTCLHWHWSNSLFEQRDDADGEISANGLIFILANGVASNGFMIDEENTKVFKRGLTDFAMDLAKLVIKDGEGTTRFVTVTVKTSLIPSLPAFYVSDR